MTSDGFDRYNGWLLLAHPHFEDQLSRWQNEVRRLAIKKPEGFANHPKVKRLATLEKLLFEVIPAQPESKTWLLGNTLGPEHRAWRRAKFMQQYRLFFRFDARSKIIVYGWVNDEHSLRAYGSRNDAYLVFKRMVEAGSPPSIWNELIDDANFFGTKP
jgi:toxin YhaV